MHYLNIGRPSEGQARPHRQLTRYFRAREKGRSVDEASQRAFGVSVEQLDDELRSYVRRGPPPGGTS